VAQICKILPRRLSDLIGRLGFTQRHRFPIPPSFMHAASPVPVTAPVIITVAPVNYGDLSRFPSAAALVEDICACHAAGASVVHFHVTDAAGRATADTTFFDSVVAGVQERGDIIIQASTGGVGVPWEVRTAALAARGLEMASLNMGSCNLFGRAYVNTPDDIAQLARKLAEERVVPDMCFFEPGFFAALEGLPHDPAAARNPVTSLCLGFPGALPASVENLVFMKSKLPPRAEWTLVHHGSHDFALLAAAIAAGGNIRVGFEDSYELGGGRLAGSNADLVRKARLLVESLDRRVATPAETRTRYGITPRIALPTS
jgi:3-keto-5-aminohexanoate cleavage enzyme